MKYRFSAIVGSLLLAGCLQDPGQTGMGYLNEQGIKLSAPLYHFNFDNLPVDSVFSTTTELDHFGDSQVVVGRQNLFTASTRLGFTLTTQAQHRQLDSGTGVGLRLVPGNLKGLIGNQFLIASLQNRDSLTLLVESFSWVDTGGHFQDSLNYYHTRLLRSRATFATLDTALRKLDTIRVYPHAAYRDTTAANRDTSQYAELRNLRGRLRAVGDSTNKWAIFLNISPMPGAADSGMFRFSSQVFGNSTTVRRYGSGLWLGRYNEDSLTTVGALLTPYRLSGTGSLPGSTYEIKYTGSSNRSLLFGVSRGMHLRISRDTLLARIKTALGPDSGLVVAASGKYDQSFYVPYAELRVPLRDSLNHVDGPFAFDVNVLSDVDSVADGDVLGNALVALGGTLNLTVTGSAGSSFRDTLRVSYHVYPKDTTLRRITLAWANDPEIVDTFTIAPDGSQREIASTRHTGWLRQTLLNVIPSPAQLSVGVHFASPAVTEASFILDSTGRAPVSETSGLKRRFYRPGADSLNLRVTRGIGTLLNRVSSAGIAPDLFIRGVDRPAYDTSTVNGKTYNRVPFPVMGEVGIPRDPDGKLRVGLDIYLYPLGGGQ